MVIISIVSINCLSGALPNRGSIRRRLQVSGARGRGRGSIRADGPNGPTDPPVACSAAPEDRAPVPGLHIADSSSSRSEIETRRFKKRRRARLQYWSAGAKRAKKSVPGAAISLHPSQRAPGRRQRTEPGRDGLNRLIVEGLRHAAHDEVVGGVMRQVLVKAREPRDEIRRVLPAQRRIGEKNRREPAANS